MWNKYENTHEQRHIHQQTLERVLFVISVLLSPTGVIERFSTPRIDTVKRSLFDTDSTSKLVKVSNADYSSSYRIETQKTIRVLKDGDGDLEKAQLVTCAKTVQHGKEVRADNY